MNFKNIKDKISSKINKQSVKTFFQKQGLYVLIFLCVVAAGITALVAWPRTDDSVPQDSGTDVSLIDVPSLEEEMAAASKTPAPSMTPVPSPSPTAKPSAQDNSNGSGSISLKKPVDGKIINSFSGDELVFFASLNIWATHNGVDIQAEKDAPVVAALSGTVEDVYADESNGGVIIISHSDKVSTVYAGLGELSVNKGDKVNAGQQIGKIGEIPKEIDLSYHLHFEYMVNGVYKDPAKYFG
jgi:murein DD-endopeptidase MepM/ murein hydrolase activator NlpD